MPDRDSKKGLFAHVFRIAQLLPVMCNPPGVFYFNAIFMMLYNCALEQYSTRTNRHFLFMTYLICVNA